MTVPCPECSTPVAAPDDLQPGELLLCAHCGVELELISLVPLRVQVYEEEEK